MWSFFWASLYQLMDEIVMFLLFLPVTVMVLIILFQFGSDLLHYFRSYWHGSSLKRANPDLTRKGVVRDLFCQ